MTFRVPWPSTRLLRGGDRLEPGREMPQLRRLLDDPVPRQVLRPGGDVRHDLDHVVDVTLRVRAPRDREPNEIRRGRLLGAVWLQPEHHRPDLASPDPASFV